MKRREDRLRGILELVAARPEGYDESKLIGRIAGEYGIAAGTVQDDLEDLELREWVSRRYHVVRTTSRGLKIAESDAKILADRKQKNLEAGS